MNVAILGYGVVGKGVYDIITNDFPQWNVKYVLEKDLIKAEEVTHLLASSLEQIITDEEIDVVIELIGGKTVAYDMIKAALKHKKHVVTANKAVISESFEELTTLAKKNNVSLLFEASVGGAIIILDPLYKIADVNQIHTIEGIINGSTNFVLSSIFLEHKSLDEALENAEQLGYIETGSTDDMDGFDLLRKINILSMISYHTYIDESSIERVPLSSLTSEFFDYVKEHNAAIKYIASSSKTEDQVSIHLEPVILAKDDFYNQIQYEQNIITIAGAYHQKQFFIGQGAGRYPTASAVVNDLLLIEQKEQRVHSFLQRLDVVDTSKDRYLVQTEKRFEVVEGKTLQEMNKMTNILCFARIKGDLL